MKITTEPAGNREIALTVEVEPERVQEEMQKAARKLSGRGKIPGYRKGKAPYRAVVRFYGEDAIFEEMLDDLAQSSYRQALDEENIEPYAPGRLVDVNKDPLTLKLMVPLPPIVELNDYREIRTEMPEVTVTDEQVDEALEKIRKDQGAWQPVERPVEKDDMVSVTFSGEVEGNVVFQEAEDFPLLVGSPYGEPLPGFAEKLIGAKAGDELDYTIQVPGDDPRAELAGKPANFHVRVQTVRVLELPPLDDDLAKMVGDYENLDALRSKVREAMLDEETKHAEEHFASDVLDAVVEQAKIEYPPIMVEEEVDDILEDTERQLKRQEQDLESYLALSGQTTEEFRESLRPRAERNLQRGLVMGELARQERIRVSPEEMNKEYQSLAEVYMQAGVPASVLESPSFQQQVYVEYRSRKTLDRLVEIATGKAPPLSAEEETPEEGAEEATAAEAEAEAGEPEAEEAPAPEAEFEAPTVREDESNSEA